MKITITDVGRGWKPDDAPADFKPIYTLTTLEHSEPIKTMDEALTVPGEHEVEQYQSKSGKTYWRVSKGAPSGQLKLETTDTTRDSIERQQCLIQAVLFVNGNMSTDDAERLNHVEAAYSSFVALLAGKQEDKVELPPIENYEQ